MNHKLVLLGDACVGKSSIVCRFATDEFYNFREPTIGSAFVTQTVVTSEGVIRFDVWDTAGQERYRSFAPLYYRGAKVAIIVYDISNRDTLIGAKSWVREVINKGPLDIIIALVGNKLDMDRKITSEEVDAFATEHNILFFEVSAKTGQNVKDMFIHLAHKIPQSDNKKIDDSVSLYEIPEKPPGRRCC